MRAFSTSLSYLWQFLTAFLHSWMMICASAGSGWNLQLLLCTDRSRTFRMRVQPAASYGQRMSRSLIRLSSTYGPLSRLFSQMRKSLSSGQRLDSFIHSRIQLEKKKRKSNVFKTIYTGNFVNYSAVLQYTLLTEWVRTARCDWVAKDFLTDWAG